LQRQLDIDFQPTVIAVSRCDLASIQKWDALSNCQAKPNSPVRKSRASETR